MALTQLALLSQEPEYLCLIFCWPVFFWVNFSPAGISNFILLFPLLQSQEIYLVHISVLSCWTFNPCWIPTDGKSPYFPGFLLANSCPICLSSRIERNCPYCCLCTDKWIFLVVWLHTLFPLSPTFPVPHIFYRAVACVESMKQGDTG